LVPSADEVIENQFLFTFIGDEVTSVHAAPLFEDVYTRPPFTTAASLVPSADEVIEIQFLFESLAVHTTA
jgi:hypothetical protein